MTGIGLDGHWYMAVCLAHNKVVSSWSSILLTNVINFMVFYEATNLFGKFIGSQFFKFNLKLGDVKYKFLILKFWKFLHKNYFQFLVQFLRSFILAINGMIASKSWSPIERDSLWMKMLKLKVRQAKSIIIILKMACK